MEYIQQDYLNLRKVLYAVQEYMYLYSGHFPVQVEKQETSWKKEGKRGEKKKKEKSDKTHVK